MPFLTANVNTAYIGVAGSMPADLGGGDPDYDSIYAWDQATKVVAPSTTELGVIVGPLADTGPPILTAGGNTRSETQRRALAVHGSIAHSGKISDTPHLRMNTAAPVLQIGQSGNPEHYFILDGVHVRNDNRTSGWGIRVHPSTGRTHIHRCISDAGILAFDGNGPDAFVISQSLFHCYDDSWPNTRYYNWNDQTRLLSSTFVGGQNINNHKINSGLIENCVLFGQNEPVPNGFYSGSSHNASDYATVTDGGIFFNATDWISIDASDFQDPINGIYAPAASSKLIAAGQDIRSIISGYADAGYAPPVDVDLAGNPRPANGADWDCGALQRVTVADADGTDGGVLLAFIL